MVLKWFKRLYYDFKKKIEESSKCGVWMCFLGQKVAETHELPCKRHPRREQGDRREGLTR